MAMSQAPTSAASRNTSSAVGPVVTDRVFYSGTALALALVVFAGFAQTFYLRSYFGAPVSITGMTTLSALTQVHGVIFTSWVLLFVVQTSLVATRKMAVHRKLGFAGAGLAAAMVAVGLPTAFAAAARGSAPPGIPPLAFLVVPVFDIVLFAGFVTAAVVRRREKEAHKRLMLLAYCAILPAAVGRIPGVALLGIPGLFALSFLPAVLGAAYDRWSRGRVTPIYWWGLAALYLSIPVRLAVSATPTWMVFAEFVTR
jgi:signal transduction histidine kinase